MSDYILTEDGISPWITEGDYTPENPDVGVTTVADLMDELQDRIPEGKIPVLFPALNRAIAILAKRLYILESDLVIGELDVNIYSTQSYTASTIHFRDWNSEGIDGIYDSADQLVIEGFKAEMPITTTCTGNEGPFRVHSVTAGEILLHPAYSLTTVAAGSSYTITSLNDYGYLPSDFLGLVDKPFITGKQYPLEPLPGQYTKLTYLSSTGTTNTGTPIYYRLQGDKLRIYPATSSDIVIGGDYFKRPTKLAHMDDILPFQGAFDDVLAEYLLRSIGGTLPIANAELQQMLWDEVDLIVPKRQKKAPDTQSRGIPWGDIY